MLLKCKQCGYENQIGSIFCRGCGAKVDSSALDPDSPAVKVGDEVLAVGTPLDIKLAGTHTFGRVSAIRGDDIQFDASVTFGNSGGPLFKKETDKYSLIGINYSGVQRQDINANINFALDKKFIKKGEYKLFDVSAVGVIPAIENYYERLAKLSEFAE